MMPNRVRVREKEEKEKDFFVFVEKIYVKDNSDYNMCVS